MCFVCAGVGVGTCKYVFGWWTCWSCPYACLRSGGHHHCMQATITGGIHTPEDTSLYYSFILASCSQLLCHSFPCLSLNALSSVGTRLGLLSRLAIVLHSYQQRSRHYFQELTSWSHHFKPYPEWFNDDRNSRTSWVYLLMQLVPARVVSLICCKRYIVMCDLLSDNAAVREHFEEIHGTVGVQLLQYPQGQGSEKSILFLCGCVVFSPSWQWAHQMLQQETDWLMRCCY